jgi:rRNA maturation protein Nop10
MGGRGRDSGIAVRQLTIEDAQRYRQIADIIQEGTQRRLSTENGVGGGSGGSTSPRLLKKCMCCGEYTIPIGSTYEVCPICGWIDDKYQNNHPDSLDRKNPMTLLQMKEIYGRKQAKSEEKEMK